MYQKYINIGFLWFIYGFYWLIYGFIGLSMGLCGNCDIPSITMVVFPLTSGTAHARSP